MLRVCSAVEPARIRCRIELLAVGHAAKLGIVPVFDPGELLLLNDETAGLARLRRLVEVVCEESELSSQLLDDCTDETDHR